MNPNYKPVVTEIDWVPPYSTESIKISNLLQFNLISGDNGVGKTHLLDHINNISQRRFIGSPVNPKNEKSPSIYYVAKRSLEKEPYRTYFLTAIMSFNSKIKDFWFDEIDHLKIELDGATDPFLVEDLGSAMWGLYQIAIDLLCNKDSYVTWPPKQFANVHPRHFRALWQMVFDIAIHANVQVFAVTYSQHLIEQFGLELNRRYVENENSNIDPDTVGRYFRIDRWENSAELVDYDIPNLVIAYEQSIDVI